MILASPHRFHPQVVQPRGTLGGGQIPSARRGTSEQVPLIRQQLLFWHAEAEGRSTAGDEIVRCSQENTMSPQPDFVSAVLMAARREDSFQAASYGEVHDWHTMG